MRIYVIEPLGQGGLIHYSYHMCRALQREGADVMLITSTDYELEHLDHEFTLNKFLKLWNARQKNKLSGFAKLLQRGGRGIRYVTEWLRLLNFLRKEKPDFILLGEIRFEFEHRFLKMLKNSGLLLADVVHDVRTYDVTSGSDSILQEDEAHLKAYDRIYNLFDVLFVHDRINRDLFLELYTVAAERVFEIPHGANEIMLEMTPSHTAQQLRDMHGAAPEQAVVLFFGTLTKYKGIEDLIKAFPAVQKATGARLVIAGYPAKDIDVDELKATAAAGGIADHVSWFLDYVPNEQVVPLMEMADVVAMPYRAISQSGILQIAYACGSPVVATRVGGLPDVIEDEKSGLLVEAENPDDLAQGLIRAINDTAMREAMGKRARELAESRYSWRYVASVVMKAMQEAQK
ncbi:MAG: glycosyltransferase family 4 protein [Anaerolineae bacterium]|nr:glycosyltransferase family 4 protein [Anaerolineae bacterium]